MDDKDDIAAANNALNKRLANPKTPMDWRDKFDHEHPWLLILFATAAVLLAIWFIGYRPQSSNYHASGGCNYGDDSGC